MVLKQHLLPVFGPMRLDAIKMHGIETFKAGLLAKALSRKRVNNVLACLGKMLRYAHENRADRDRAESEASQDRAAEVRLSHLRGASRLVEAMKADPQRLALVLLGADAGLRQSEILALQWGT